VRVELLDDDDAALDELLAFASEHGRPRASTATEYRWIVDGRMAAWQAIAVRDDADELRAAALVTWDQSIGLDQVQLNAFGVPGDQASFDLALEAAAAWSLERDATTATAHVSEPSDDAVRMWLAAGFEQVGERWRVGRDVTAADRSLEPVAIEGVAIVALADRPELEAGAEALWRVAHDDVPSALRFSADQVPTMRSTLGVADDERMPPSVLLAVTGNVNVVGLVVGVIGYAGDPAILGHRMTATARDWRGRGLARALKVELLRRAPDLGVTRCVASNDSGNAPMRAVNESLGYEVEYRLVLMRQALTG
jgi:RimJ/RimL family protein N-acetyltransferase